MNTNIDPDTPENYSQQPHNGTPQPQTHNGTAQTKKKILSTKTCDAWIDEAETQPPITPLFDAFWQRGELAFLFSKTGIGKTILAVQIADAISKGAKIQGFDGPQKPMKVGLFDFEMSDTQHLRRYIDESGNVYQFSDNFWRFAPRAPIPKDMKSEDLLLEEIEKKIIKHQLEAVVIDSLTYMPIFTGTRNELNLLMRLRLIKLRQNISMLVVGHSLRQDSSLPITEDDMPNSIYLLSLCDSAFAIGESAKEKNVRYLKQIKTSSDDFKYDDENVAVFRLVKRNRFIGFEHIGFDCEYEHL